MRYFNVAIAGPVGTCYEGIYFSFFFDSHTSIFVPYIFDFHFIIMHGRSRRIKFDGFSSPMFLYCPMDRLNYSQRPPRILILFSDRRIFTKQSTFRRTVPIGIISSRGISHGTSQSPLSHKNIPPQYWSIRTYLPGYPKSTLNYCIIPTFYLIYTIITIIIQEHRFIFPSMIPSFLNLQKLHDIIWLEK